MLLLWLGVVVLSSADRRSWGIWLTGGGLLCSGAFFLIHSAIIGRGLRDATADLDLMWHLGWISIIASPLAWYVVVLWYAGFLGAPVRQNLTLRRLQVPGLVFTSALALLLVVLLVVLGALPTFAQVLTFGAINPQAAPLTPLLVGLYALYNIVCMSLAIHALQHPEPSARWMGDLARRRARPWLTSASIVLLVVSLLVSAFLAILYFASGPGLAAQEQDLRRLFAEFDLLISTLIAAAVVLIGKATVSYKSLPEKPCRAAVFFVSGSAPSSLPLATASLSPRQLPYPCLRFMPCSRRPCSSSSFTRYCRCGCLASVSVPCAICAPFC